MKRSLHPIVAALAFCFVASSPAVHATLVSAQETSVILQDISSAFDFMAATAFLGAKTGETLNYQSSANASEWSGALTGTYQGESVSVNYSGDLTGFPSSAVTWTSNGTFGSSILSSTGSALVTDTVDGFSLEVDYSVNFNGNTGALLDKIFEVNVSPGVPFVQLALEDESGEIKLDDIWIKWTISYNEKEDGTYTDDLSYTITDEATGKSKSGVIKDDSKGKKDKDDQSLNISGTITKTVPEPSSGVLLGVGLLTLFSIRRQFRRRIPA